MQRKSLIITSLLTIFFLASCVIAGQLPSKFDPARDPSKDLKTASEMASESGKNILMDVGGSWCSWCGIMEKWLKDNRDVNSYLHDNYVLLKVNFSRENSNEKFLSRFPEPLGYPHFFVLSSDGKSLHSQGTEALERGNSYDKKKFMEFLKKWTPKKNKN